ncbi:uncharacterized protein LOC142240157 [Haematobia irritans]|uniref:uncharacterized protein LOC142240157 n=1 Tax=Haematobia irritans TaxID=7368 RepID=UPI003F4F6626
MLVFPLTVVVTFWINTQVKIYRVYRRKIYRYFILLTRSIFLISAADDFFDADECTGFGTVESLDPPSTTPSVIEILAAMALGPMLAVPAADEPATLSAAELITMNELKNLALNEIKSRSYEMYPHSLGVIPEEMGEFDLKNFPTPDELENQINLALVDNSDIVVEKESPQTSANQIKFKTGCVEPQIVEAEIKPEILPINEPACVANAVQDISVMDPAVAEINYITTIKTEAKIDSEKVQIEQKVEPVVVQDSPQIEPEAVQIIEPVEKESQHKNIAETTCATILETTVQDISIINPAVAEINDNTTIAIEAKVDSEAVQIEQSVESSVVQESHQIEPEAQQIEPAAVQIIEPVEIKSQHADTAPTMCAAIPEHAVTKINDNPTIGIDAKVDSEIEIEQKVESVVVQNSQQIEPEAVRMIEPVERESQHADTARTTCASIPEPGIQDISIMDPAVAEINDNTTNRIAAKVDLETVQIEVQVESAVVQDSQQIEPAAVQIIKPVELTSQHAVTEPTTCAAIPEPAVAEINDNTIIGTDAKVDSEKVQIEHKVESAVAQDSQQIEPEADQKIEQVEKESQHADNAPMTCAAIPAPAIHDISTMNPVVAEINDNTRIGIEAKVESETVQIEQTVESYVVLKSLQLEPEAVQIIEPVEIKSQHKNIAETTCAEIPEPTVAEINDNTTIRIKAIVDSETVQKEQKIEVAVVQDSQQIEPEAVQIIETVEKALQHAYTAPTTFAFVQDISIMDSAVAEINDSTTNGIAANIDSETVRIEYRTVEFAVVQDSQQIEPVAVQIIEPDDIKSQHADTAPTTCAAIPEPAVPGINDNTTIGIVAVVQDTQQIETEAVQIIEPVEKKSQHVNIAETTCATIPEAGVQGISTINPAVAEINDNTTIGIEAKVDTEPVQIEQKVESAVVQDSQQIEPAAVQIIEQVEKESQHADNAPTTCAAIPEAAIQDKSIRCTAVAEINENTKIGIEAKVGSEPVQIEQTVESSVVQESQQIEQETVQINEPVEIKSQPADTAPTIYAAIPEPTVAEINDNTTIRIEAIVDSETVQIEQKVESAVVQNSQQIEPEAVQIIEPVEKESQHANTAPTTRASIPEPEVQDICIMDPAVAEMNDDTIIGIETKVDSEPVRIDQTDESSVVQESQIEPEAVQIIESIEIKSQHADTAPTIPAAIPESAVAEINDNTTIVIDPKVDTETVQIEQKVESAVVQDSQQIEPTGDQIIEQVKKESQPADTAPATCDAIPEPVVAEINDSTTIGIDAKIDSETVQIEQKVESAVVQDSQQIEPEAVHIIEPVDIKSQHADTAPTTCAAIPEPAVPGINDNTTIGIVAVVQDTQQIETEAVQIIEPVEKKSQHVNIAETTCATIPEAGVQGISTINPTVAEINDNTTIGIEAKVDTEPVQIEQKVESAVVQDSQQIEPAAVQIIEQVEKESQHADNAPTTWAAIPEAAIQDKSIRCTAVAEINENTKIGIEAKVGSEPVQIEQTVESSVVQESQQIEQETVQINEPVEIKSQPADTAPTIYAAIPEPTVAEINDNTTIRIEAIVDSETVQIEQKVESAVVQNSQQIEPEAVQIIEPVEKESQHANTAPTTRASIPEPEVQDICIMDPAVAEMNDDTIIGIEPKVDSEPVRIDQTDESSVVQESQIEPEAVQIIESIEIKSQHADTAPTIPAAIPESAVAEINDNTTIVIDAKVDTETVQIEQKVESAVVQDSQQIEPTGDQIIEQVKKESQPADTAPATCDAIPEPVVAEINDSTTIGIDAKIDSETVQIEQKVESAVVQDSQHIEPEAVHIIEPVDIKSQHADTAPTTCAAIPEIAIQDKSIMSTVVDEINDNATIGIEAKVDSEAVQIEQTVEFSVAQESQHIEPEAVQIIEPVQKESQNADTAPTTCAAIPEPGVHDISIMDPAFAETNDRTTNGIATKVGSETVQIEQNVESAVVQDSQQIEPAAVQIIAPVGITSQHADAAPAICAALPERSVAEINDNTTIRIAAKVDSETVQIEQKVESAVVQNSQQIEPEAVQIIVQVEKESQHEDIAPTYAAIPEPVVAEINDNTTIEIDAKVDSERMQIEQQVESAVVQDSQHIEPAAVQTIKPVQIKSQHTDTAPTTCAVIQEPAVAEINDNTPIVIDAKVDSERVQIEQQVESTVVQDSQHIEPAAVKTVEIKSQHADTAQTTCAVVPEPAVAEINDNTTIGIEAKVDSEPVQIEEKVESSVIQDSQQIEPEAVQIIESVEIKSQHADSAPTTCAAIPEPAVAEINDNTTIGIEPKVDSETVQIEQIVESAVVQDSQQIEPKAVQITEPVEIKSQHANTEPTTCAAIPEPVVAEINDNTTIRIDAKVNSETVQIEQKVESAVAQDSQQIEPADVQIIESVEIIPVDSETVQIEQKVESSVIQDSQQIEPEAVQIIESVEIRSQHADTAPMTYAAIIEPAVADINDNTTIGIVPKVDSETVQIEQKVESTVVQNSQQIEPEAVQIIGPVEIKSQHADTAPTTCDVIPDPAVTEINDNATIGIDAKVDSERIQIERDVESAVIQDSQHIVPAAVDTIEPVDIKSQHADTVPTTCAAIPDTAVAEINDNTTIGIDAKVDSETVQIERNIEPTVVQDSQKIEPEGVQIIESVEIRSQHADTAPMTYAEIPEPAVSDINDNTTIGIEPKFVSETVQIKQKVESTVVQDSQQIEPAAVQTIEPVEIKSQLADTAPTTCTVIPEPAVIEINDNTTIVIDAKVDSERMQIEQQVESAVVQDSQHIEPAAVQTIEPVEIKSQDADTASTTCAAIPEPAVAEIDAKVEQTVESAVVQDSQQIEPAAVQTIEPVEIKSQLADTAPMTCTVIPEPAVNEINDNATIGIDAKVDSERVQKERDNESAVVQDSQHIEPAAVQTIEPVEIKSQDANTAPTTCAAIPEPAVAEIDAKVDSETVQIEKKVESALVQDSQHIEPEVVQIIEPVEIRSQHADNAPMTATAAILEPAVQDISMMNAEFAEINDNTTIGLEAKCDLETMKIEQKVESAVIQDSQRIKPETVQIIEPVEKESHPADTAPTTCAAIPEPAGQTISMMNPAFDEINDNKAIVIETKLDSETVRIEQQVESAIVQCSQHIEPAAGQIIEPVEIKSDYADTAPTICAAIPEPAVAEINDNTTNGIDAKVDSETVQLEQKVESAVVQGSQQIDPEAVQTIEPVEIKLQHADTASTTCTAIPEPAVQDMSIMDPVVAEINDNTPIAVEAKLDSETEIEENIESAVVQNSQQIAGSICSAVQLIEPVEIKSQHADAALSTCTAIPKPAVHDINQMDSAVAEINDNKTIDAKIVSETLRIEEEAESNALHGSQTTESEAVQIIEPVGAESQHAHGASTICAAIPEHAIQDTSIMEPPDAEINDNTTIGIESKCVSDTEQKDHEVESAVANDSPQIEPEVVQIIEPVDVKSEHVDTAPTCAAIPAPDAHDVHIMNPAVADVSENITSRIKTVFVLEAVSAVTPDTSKIEPEAIQIVEGESQYADTATMACITIPEPDPAGAEIDVKVVSETPQLEHELVPAVAQDSSQIEPEAVQITEPVSQHADIAPTIFAAMPEPPVLNTSIMAPPVSGINVNTTIGIETKVISETGQVEHEVESAVVNDSQPNEPEADQVIEPVEAESQHANIVPTIGAAMPATAAPNTSRMDTAAANLNESLTSDVDAQDSPKIEPAVQIVEPIKAVSELAPATCATIASSQIETEAVQKVEPIKAALEPTCVAIPEPALQDSSLIASAGSEINDNITTGVGAKDGSDTLQREQEVKTALAQDSPDIDPGATQIVEKGSLQADIATTVCAVIPETAVRNTSLMDPAGANTNKNIISDVENLAQDSLQSKLEAEKINPEAQKNISLETLTINQESQSPVETEPAETNVQTEEEVSKTTSQATLGLADTSAQISITCQIIDATADQNSPHGEFSQVSGQMDPDLGNSQTIPTSCTTKHESQQELEEELLTKTCESKEIHPSPAIPKKEHTGVNGKVQKEKSSSQTLEIKETIDMRKTLGHDSGPLLKDSFVPDEIGKLTESFKPPFITNTILNAECRQNVPYELSQFNVKTENQRTIEMAKMLDPKEIIIKNDTHVNMEPKPENILLSATNQIGEKTIKPHGLLHIENNSIIITKRTISSSESDVAETQIQSDIEESKNLIYNNSISSTSPLDLEDNGIIVITPQIWEESVVNVGSKTEDLKLHIDDSLVSKDNISRAVSALSLEKLDEARMHFVSNNDNNPMRSSPQTNSELNETIVLIRHEDIKTTESPKRISKSVIAENVMSHLEVKTEQAIYIESESLIHHDRNIILVAQGIPSKENIELKKVAELENNISPVGTSFNTESQSKRYISALGLKTDQSSTLSTEHLEFLTIEAKSTINSFEEQDEILSHHSTLCENVTTLDSVTTLPKLRDTSSQIESITLEQQFPDNTIIMHQKKNNLSEIRRHDQEEINPDSISEESVYSANEARLHSSDALQTEKAIDAIPTYPVLRTEISEEITSPSDTCSCSNSMEGTLTGTMSEDLSPKTAVSKNNTSQCSLDLAAYDTKSFEDSTNFTRQSTTLEFEIDTHIPDNSENPVSATDSIARPLLASQSNFKKLKRQYGMECTTPSFEDGSQQLFEPPSLPPPLPYSGSNTLATICHQYIKDKHLLAALETRRRQTLLMHKFLSTIDSYHSNDETCGSIEDTSQAHAEVLQQKCENRTSPSPTTTTNPTLSPTPPPMTHGYGGVQGTTHHTSHRQCSEFNEDNGSDWFSVSVVDHFPISFNFINTILFSHDISHHSDNSGTVPSSRATSVEDIFTMTDDEKDILVHKKNTMRRRRRKSTPMMAVNRNTTTANKKPSANRVKLNDKSSSGKKHTSISNSYLIPNKLTNSPDGYPRTEINYTATNPNTNSSTKSKACHKENSSEVVALPKLVSDSAKVEIDNSPGVSEISQKAHTETPKQHSESEHVLSSITNVVNLVSDQIEDERSKALVEGTSHEKEFISQTPKPKETEEFKSEKAKIVTQRPSSLNLGRKDSSGSACATPTRGSTPPAFKFLQPKRKLMDPSHILSFEEDEETQEATGGFSSEKPVIEKEVAHALPSVKALARAFLMTSAPTQRSHENVWLRKTKTLSASGKSPSTPVHSKGSHDLSIPTDSTNVGVPIKDGKTSEDTKDLDTNDNMSSSALSAATTTPTGNNNSNVLPVRKGVLKSNIAFFENLKNN